MRLKWGETEYKGRLLAYPPPTSRWFGAASSEGLKWERKRLTDFGWEGKLNRVSIDSYMNIQLANAEEYIKNNFSGSLGQVLIRCNNVLWIRAAGAADGENGDVKMEG